MKKMFLFIVLCMGIAAYTYAEKVAMQYIITDCGTVHQIPSNSTEDEALYEYFLYSTIDCYM